MRAPATKSHGGAQWNRRFLGRLGTGKLPGGSPCSPASSCATREARGQPEPRRCQVARRPELWCDGHVAPGHGRCREERGNAREINLSVLVGLRMPEGARRRRNSSSTSLVVGGKKLEMASSPGPPRFDWVCRSTPSSVLVLLDNL